MRCELAVLALLAAASPVAAQPGALPESATNRALSNAAHNATNNQQQSYVTDQASTTQGVATWVGPLSSEPPCPVAKCPKPAPPAPAKPAKAKARPAAAPKP